MLPNSCLIVPTEIFFWAYGTFGNYFEIKKDNTKYLKVTKGCMHQPHFTLLTHFHKIYFSKVYFSESQLKMAVVPA